MWRNWNPLNPPINHQSSEDEQNNYESADDDLNHLVSPNRPHQSPSASPRALLRPDPPTVDEVLAGVEQRLHRLPTREERAERRNAVRQQEAAAAAAQVADMPTVNYDKQNLEDDEGAIQNARDVKLPFNKNDILLWFTLIESKMQFAGLKKQWSKRQVLIQLIPPEHHSDFRHHLQLQETQAGQQAYFDLKSAIIKRFGPKQADGFDKAISRVMGSEGPSHFGRQIMSDICPEFKPLHGCHCAGTVLGIWRRGLPSIVRTSIADMAFDSATWQDVFDKADNVWASNAANTSVVAALAKGDAATEVAAATTKPPRRNNRGGGRGGRGGGGGGAGRGGRTRGPRHADNPPNNACDVHWKWGKAAWHCADRHSCPWRDFESPKPKHNRNIVAGAEIVD